MYKILYFVIILYSTIAFGAQDSLSGRHPKVKFDTTSTLTPIEFDNEKIKKFKGEKAFNYITETEESSWWTRFKRWLGFKYEQIMEWLFGKYKSNTLVSFFLRLLPYIIIGMVLGFIIWLFIRLNPGPSLLGNTESPKVFLHEEEKLVYSQDLSYLIETAIKNKDYRLAVRYNYLKLLKILHQKNLINYEFQKTDSEYLLELKDDTFRLPLMKVMRIYDFIWYGNFPVSAKEFRIVQDSFQDIESLLNKGDR